MPARAVTYCVEGREPQSPDEQPSTANSDAPNGGALRSRTVRDGATQRAGHCQEGLPSSFADLGTPIGREGGYRHPAVVVTAQRLLDASPSVVYVLRLTRALRGYASQVGIEADRHNGHDPGKFTHPCSGPA